MPGAKGVAPIGTFEYFFNSAVANLMRGYAADHGCMSTIFFRDNLTLRETYNQVIKWKPDCVIELHFNAANGVARGTETLFGDQNALSGSLAKVIQEGMCKLYRRDAKTNRGIKKLKEEDRGFTNVNLAKCPSALVEPFFGDQVDDAQLGVQYQESLASSLVESMILFLMEHGGFK